jgi:hypothetical protein
MGQCKCRFNTLVLGLWCVTKCGCHSMHLHFNLQPLPIMGLGYWWNLDFGDSLSLIMEDNWYVLVIIEHFSKWLKLVLLLDHSNKEITYAILYIMLKSFGALGTKILINQKTKFCGKFHMCVKTLIDHCLITWNHFKANDLSWTNGADNEMKCVHMAFKRAILNIKIYNDHG